MKENTIDRKTKFKKRYDMYKDNYHDQIEEKLGLIYSAFVALKLDVQINDNNNLYKQIINSISNVYSYGVKRTFENPICTTETPLQDMYNYLQVDKTMAQANRYCNAFNDILVQVSWDMVINKPKLILRLPHQTEVQEADGRVVSVEYFVGFKEKDKTEIWAHWTNTEHYYVYKLNGAVVYSEADKQDFDIENPFNTLPFVFLHNGWRDSGFWDTYTGDDLVGGTLSLAINLTFLNHIIKAQSFKQLVAKGSNISELKGQIGDPNSILSLTGVDTEISVLDMQSNYEQLHKVINDIVNNIALNYNISPNQFRMTGSTSSGFALQMENLKLDRFVKEQQQDFCVYEKQLFELIKVVAGYYDETNKCIDNTTMHIDFIEPNYPQSIPEKIDVIEREIALGLTTPAKVLMSRNPELDKKEAQAIIDQNLSDRNKMLDKVGGGMNNTDIDKVLGA